MAKSSVSVIVPIYKAEKYIARCATSLFDQTLQNMQFVFVDDCSPDNSLEVLSEIIKDYPNRNIKIVSHTENKGVAVARNSGLEICDGEYVAYCDADDFVDVCMYEELYNKASEANADSVLCDFYMHYGENDNIVYNTIRLGTKEDTIKKYISYDWTLISTLMAKKSIYDKNRLSFTENIKYCEDFHLNFNLLYASNVITKVDKLLYYYNRTNENSSMNHLNDESFMDERYVYDSIMKKLRSENTLKIYEREISWRVLKNKQDLVLDPQRHNEFMKIHPNTHKYILSCPMSFCNVKIKIMMWMLTHHCRIILLALIFIRNMFK